MALASRSARAASRPPCPKSADHCKWIVYRVQKLPGTRPHNWNDCVEVVASSTPQQETCSLASTSTHTVTADITGGVDVGFASLSAAAGYQVAKSTTASDSVRVPAGESGKIQWRAVFAYLKAIDQRYVQCDGNNRCKDIHNSPPSDFAEAIVDKYNNLDFRFVVTGRTKPHHHQHGHRRH